MTLCGGRTRRAFAFRSPAGRRSRSTPRFSSPPLTDLCASSRSIDSSFHRARDPLFPQSWRLPSSRIQESYMYAAAHSSKGVSLRDHSRGGGAWPWSRLLFTLLVSVFASSGRTGSNWPPPRLPKSLPRAGEPGSSCTVHHLARQRPCCHVCASLVGANHNFDR